MERAIAIIGALILSGCADTKIYENGQPVMKMQADATNVTLQTPSGTYFHADTIIHSTPTLAGAQGATQVIGGLGGFGATIGTAVIAGGAVQAGHATAALVATAAPALVSQAQGVVRPTNINVMTAPTQVAVPEGQIITVQRSDGVLQTFRVAKVQRHRVRHHRVTHNDSPPSDE